MTKKSLIGLAFFSRVDEPVKVKKAKDALNTTYNFLSCSRIKRTI